MKTNRNRAIKVSSDKFAVGDSKYADQQRAHAKANTRPPRGMGTVVQFTIPYDMAARIEAWRVATEMVVGAPIVRTEALRLLIVAGLKASPRFGAEPPRSGAEGSQ